jgi:MFS family permease
VAGDRPPGPGAAGLIAPHAIRPRRYGARMRQNLDVGGVLSRVFEYYRDQAALLIPAALVIFVPVALVNGGLRAADSVFLVLVANAVQLIGNAWYQGTVVEAVRDIRDGRRDFTLGDLFASALGVIWPLVAVGILFGVGVFVGFILLIVPGLFLLTIWAVVVPVTVVERPGVIEAFGRSRELVRGNGWPVFGVLVILFLIQAAATAILVAIFIGIGDFVGYAIAALIASTLLAPLSALAASVMYFELRPAPAEPPPAPGGPPPSG